MKLVLKGIVTREDAEIALQHGADAVWVSNHGGRAENSLRSAIDCVPEVAAGVGGTRARASSTAVSAAARTSSRPSRLARTPVGIGRPYIWGLASFGQEGVEVVFSILRRELQMVMRQAGTTALARITGDHVIQRSR